MPRYSRPPGLPSPPNRMMQASQVGDTTVMFHGAKCAKLVGAK